MKQAMVIALAGIFLAAASCGGKEAAPAPKTAKEYPEWVIKGSGAFGGEKQIFYGVGAASGIRNVALARTTSDNRARAEIAKIFETYTASLMKDYMASTTAGDMSAVSEEQHVEQAIKTFSATTLSGVQIVNHWVDPDDGTWYAMARLDLEQFKDSLDKMKELSDQVKNYVRKNAERVHMDLEKEEAKRAQ